MANTYTLISSNVLTGSAASVTFSSIPSTYTDLVLKCSIRGTQASDWLSLRLKINNDASAFYSDTTIEGAGSGGASSFRNSGSTTTFLGQVNGSTTTSNTFSNNEIYIPSYTASQSKPLSSITASETNATVAIIHANANLYRSNTAISQLYLSLSSGNFDTGSSFYLYGIKNS